MPRRIMLTALRTRGVAERKQILLLLTHTTHSEVDRDADGGGDDLKVLDHILRFDTGIAAKAARADHAGVGENEDEVLEDRLSRRWIYLVFAHGALSYCLDGRRRRIAKVDLANQQGNAVLQCSVIPLQALNFPA